MFRASGKGPKASPEITAVFPSEPADMGGVMMVCYSHVGQHGGCSPQWVASTRPAKPEEYADLLKELAGQGYDKLRVVQRITPEMREVRMSRSQAR